jgi:large subunit ribosomal protein L15
VNVGRLQQAVDAGKLDAGKTVTEDALVSAGIIKSKRDGVRILAKGEISAVLRIEVTGASKGAVEAVEKAGGNLTVTGVAKEKKSAPEKEKAPGSEGLKPDVKDGSEIDKE